MRPPIQLPPRPFEILAPTILKPGAPRRQYRPAVVTPLYQGWSWLHLPTSTDGPARTTHAQSVALIAAVHAGLRTAHWFCGVSSALIHGCETVFLDGFAHLIQLHNQQRGANPQVKRHTAVLRVGEMTVVDGLPVTDLARTVVDCARTLSDRQALVIADSALRRGLSPADLESALVRGSGSRGIRQAQAILSLADARAESAGESLLRLLIVRGGLPTPELQIAVDTHLGWRYVDLGWSDLKVAVEFDGRIKYDTSGAGTAFFDEKRRQDALEELGWLVVRVMWEDLWDAAALVSRLEDALRRQQRRRTFA